MTNDQRGNAAAPIAERVEELLGQMTLEEKAAQMVQVPYPFVGREAALEWAKKGAGSFLHVWGDEAREVQRTALNSRLGVPVLFGIDAIHGHGLNEHATIFPSQLAAACAWDIAMTEEMGRVTAREVATDGLHWTFSPVLCLGRDTRWGRVDETFGEDPMLAGELGAAIIRGYQGQRLDGPESILACAKHYIGYGEAVGARDACDTEMTWRKLREVFLPPFAKAVEAGCATFMTAYGSIDGAPFTASRKALHDILREELGFDGLLVTDWDNMNSLVSKQHVAETTEDAARMTAEAGNDMMMVSLEFYDAAIRLVREGRMSETVLDEAVRHILTVKLRAGLFEHPEKSGKPGCIGCPEHLEQSLLLARETVTLLRNNGALPLNPGTKKIAVIGPNAEDVIAQYGDWTYFTHPMPHFDHPPVRPYVTVLEGVRREAERIGAEVVYEKGCDVWESETDDLDKAVEAARGADSVILAVGDRPEQMGEFHDRANLDMSGRQRELFRRLRALGIPLTVVLVSTKPLCLHEVASQADALVVAFNGGMFGGQAVAEALFGVINPCGKLPLSFPAHSGQVPVYYNQLPGWHGGKYVDMPDGPDFVFGEGKGYAAFRYGQPVFDQESLTVRAEVTNSGDRDGAEVAQVYLHDVVSSLLTPVKRLIAFQRVCIPAGETVSLTFPLSWEDFSLVNAQEPRVVEPGEFELMIGASSRDEDLQTLSFRLEA